MDDMHGMHYFAFINTDGYMDTYTREDTPIFFLQERGGGGGGGAYIIKENI